MGTACTPRHSNHLADSFSAKTSEGDSLQHIIPSQTNSEGICKWQKIRHADALYSFMDATSHGTATHFTPH